MLGNFAKNMVMDSVGLSDIGVIVPPSQFNQTQSDDFLLEGEMIYFLIKTKADEYCFTNLALIHVDGANAVSKKRTLKRYDYSLNDIVNVALETAGTIDLDVELTFNVGHEAFHISIKKDFIESARDIYQALKAMELEKVKNRHLYDMLVKNVTALSSNAGSSLKTANLTDAAQLFEHLLQRTEEYHIELKDKYIKDDYGYLFEKYINQ